MFKLSLFLSYPCIFTLVLFADVIGEFYIKIKEKKSQRHFKRLTVKALDLGFTKQLSEITRLKKKNIE